MITPRQTFATQVQFTADTHRQRVHVCVQHIHPAAGHAAANRRVRRLTALAHLGPPQQRRDHGFGRAIAVDQSLRAQRLFDPFKTGVRHRITAKAVGVNGRWIALRQRHIGQLLQVRRREARHAHVVGMQHR